MPQSIDFETKRIACAATLLCLMAAAPALAQEAATEPATDEAAPADVPTIPVAAPEEAAPASPAEASADAGPVELETVIVTATKREQSLRDIPASIGEFDGAKLEEQGKLGLNEYLQQTPGVTLTQIAPNFPRISMRGISTDTSGLSALPSPTGIFIGDTAFSDPYISNVQPDLSAFDLSSVEVLKGPQGTLFGGAALAGAIRYVLAPPKMGEWQARAFTQAISPKDGTDEISAGAIVNVPLYSDSLALRVGYVRRNYPGVTDLIDHDPVDKNVDHGDSDQVRGILAWQPLDGLLIKLTHLNQDYSSPNSTNSADTPHARERSHQVLPAPVDTKFALDSLEAGWDFHDVRAVSLTSYTTKHAHVLADATTALIGPPPAGYPPELGAFEFFDDKSKAFAQELRLQSTGDDPFQWLAGVYYYKYKVRFEIAVDTIAHQMLLGNGTTVGDILSGLGAGSLFDKSSLLYALSKPDATERAGFFDLSYRLFDRLDLSAGARVYSTEVKGGFFGTGVLALAENNGQDINATDNSIKENGVSPKFTATWHFSDDISLYAQVARGFRFGGLQSVPSTPTNGVPKVYKSDSLWNYETGLRTAWFDNTLHADLTAFDIEYKNPQIGQTTTGIPLNYTDNVGGARSRGLEASLRWLTPLRGLSVAADGALTDSKTTKMFTAATGDEISTGTQMPGAAKSQYSVETDYLVPLGALLVGTSVNYAYVGKGYADISHTVAINDYGTLNAGLTFTSDAWSVKPTLAFNVSNILDTTHAVGGGTLTSLSQSSATSYQLNPPRMFSLRLSVDF